jgi:GNAT superfamily N-acetyltransferase
MRFLLRLIKFFFSKDELPLRVIHVQEKINYFQPWNAPNPDIVFHIFDEKNRKVGTGSYGLSPLNDKVYLHEIRIEREWQRQGFGFAMIRYLIGRYHVPITPVHEWESAQGFWEAARRKFSGKLGVTIDIRANEMDAERQRWSHLQSEIIQLEKEISQRLQTEDWESATSRGLSNLRINA